MKNRRGWFPARAGATAATAALLLAWAPPPTADAQAVESPQASGVAVDRVTAVRRILRSACGKLQNAMAEEAGRAAWLAQATAEIEEGARLWETLRSEFPAVGAGPYAGHPEWRQVAGEIAAGIEEMLARARAGEEAPARSACGQNCGRFTALNETAGLELAPDALFRFRQAARPLAELMTQGDQEGVRKALPRLEELAARASEWPATSPAPPEERSRALATFSTRLEAFVRAVREGAEAAAPYAAMMEALERAYDAVL